MESVLLKNGNGNFDKTDIPTIYILDKFINDVALLWIKDRTGLEFVKNHIGYKCTPTSFSQIAFLFMTYNFKSKYTNNSSDGNTLWLLSNI